MTTYRIRYFLLSDPNLTTRVEYVTCDNRNKATALFRLARADDDAQITSVDVWDIPPDDKDDQFDYMTRVWRVEYFWRKDGLQVRRAAFEYGTDGEDAAGRFHCDHEDDDVQITRVTRWA